MLSVQCVLEDLLHPTCLNALDLFLLGRFTWSIANFSFLHQEGTTTSSKSTQIINADSVIELYTNWTLGHARSHAITESVKAEDECVHAQVRGSLLEGSIGLPLPLVLYSEAWNSSIVT